MLQVTFNGLVTGAIVALPALAVTLLFGVLKFPNFAAGSIMTFAAYVVFAFNVQLGLPLIVSTLLGTVACAAMLVAVDAVVFRFLRERGSITLMVASLGLGFVLENVARLFYGNASRSFAIELSRPFRLLGLRMNLEQMVSVGVSVLLIIAVWLLLTRVPIGRAMRAIADNPSLAQVRGIDRMAIIRWTWVINGALLGVAGVLVGMDRALEPIMGSTYLIAVFASAILGGLGSPLGALVGALIVGTASELSTLVLPPSYRIGIPLCVITAVLIFRPQGLFGQANIKR